ncbi:hypothetical protein ABPG77_010235 [Micractinium sp. CCAP 211/92]
MLGTSYAKPASLELFSCKMLHPPSPSSASTYSLGPLTNPRSLTICLFHLIDPMTCSAAELASSQAAPPVSWPSFLRARTALVLPRSSSFVVQPSICSLPNEMYDTAGQPERTANRGG